MTTDADVLPPPPPVYQICSGDDLSSGEVHDCSLSVTCGPSKVILDEEYHEAFAVLDILADGVSYIDKISDTSTGYPAPAVDKLLTVRVKNISKSPKRFWATVEVQPT
jgi:hypothetical protein